MDPMQAAVKPVTDAAVEVARGFLQKLVGPVAEEVGRLLEDHVRVFRLSNQVRILAKAKRMLAEANVNPKAVQLKVLVPLMEHASLEDDDELQVRWAALIANAATGENGQPVFAEMLGHLSGPDARLLDGLFDKVNEVGRGIAPPGASVLGHLQNVDLGDFGDLMRVYVTHAICRPDLSSVSWRDHISDPQYREVCRDFGLARDKMLLKRILWGKQIPDAVLPNRYFMTVIGYEFIAACRPPKPSTTVERTAD